MLAYERLIVTASYWTTPPDICPARITLGVPEGFFGLDLRCLTLPRSMWGDGWQDRYRTVLDRRADRVLAVVTDALDTYGRICLCCFEADPCRCHRSIAAAWLAEQGIPVGVVR